MSLPVITYTDSLNRVFNLMVNLDTGDTNSLENGGRIFSAAFHDFSWNRKTYEQRYGEHVLGFTKAAKEYAVTLLFWGSTTERMAALDKFHEAIENDIMNDTPGTLRWNDFTIKCYIVSSKTQPSQNIKGMTENEVTIYCPYPFWRRTTKRKFFIQDLPEQDLNDVKVYPNKYPFNYLSRTVRQDVITNDALSSSRWNIIINGFADSPTIKIGNLQVSVNVLINSGEYLTINNIEKTIILTNSLGRKTNCFGYRDLSTYMFEDITSGDNVVKWDGAYSWELSLIEERSEPRWTS